MRRPAGIAPANPIAYFPRFATGAAMDKSEFHEEIAGAHDNVLIVDFGSQVTQLIARRVREAGVYSEIAPVQTRREAHRAAEAEGDHPLRRSGIGASTGTRRARRTRVYEAGVPVLGICYGEQAMAHAARRQGRGRTHREFGRADVEVTEPAPCSTACGRTASVTRSG